MTDFARLLFIGDISLGGDYASQFGQGSGNWTSPFSTRRPRLVPWKTGQDRAGRWGEPSSSYYCGMYRLIMFARGKTMATRLVVAVGRPAPIAVRGRLRAFPRRSAQRPSSLRPSTAKDLS
jgi:hypothetical protein